MNASSGLTESEVEAFLTKLKLSDTDKKVDQIQFFGLQLEGATEIPPSTLDALTLTLAPLLRSSNHLLTISLLTSILPFYLPLIPTSPSSSLHVALNQLLPALFEKLNDPKERIHSSASSCIAIFGRKCYDAESSLLGTSTASSAFGKGKEKEGLVGFWERNVKEAMAGKGWRGKVESMKILLVLRGEEKSKLQLKPWLSTLVDLLEDSDGNVRDQARETVVALLAPSSTPPAARSELKKLLTARNVRKTIADGIITRIFAGDSTSRSESSAQATKTAGTPTDEAGTVQSRAATPVSAGDEVEIVYVANGRDLENEFASMVPYFEGKETEHNWAQREKSIVRTRGLLRGKAYQKYPESFVSGLKAGVMEGIQKTLMSLRTTVAQQSCAVVQELAENLGSAFDVFVENLLPILGKMAGFTKKIIAEKSQQSMTAILIYSTCHPRMFISHISAGTNEKNVQTRHYCTSHLKTFIDIHGSKSKHTIESTNGLLDMMEGSIKKGLADVNPQVRDQARAAFWAFNGVWPTKAQAIMGGLDGVAKKQLDKANPRDANGVVAPAAVESRPGMPKKPQASSAMSQLLAEKRRAKAAELAAGRAAQDSPRTVSSPIPASPSLAQKSRSVSTQHVPQAQATPLKRSSKYTETSPSPTPASPSPSSSPTGPRAVPKNASSTPQNLLQRSRSSSLGRPYSTSPSSSRGSPTISKSPLSRSEVPSGLRSPTSSSGTSSRHTLKTPTLTRTQLQKVDHSIGLGFSNHTPPSASLNDLSATPNRGGEPQTIVDEALQAQAAQAVSAAQQLLDFSDDESLNTLPVTPARPATNGYGNGRIDANLIKTPLPNFLNGESPRGMWEDSPRPEALTPLMLSKLKERTHERSWWIKRQELLDKASPLKVHPDPQSTISADVAALQSGQPQLRNLQKLTLFAEEHVLELDGDEEDLTEGKKVWENERLFDRIFEGLMTFLQPSQPIELLEQGLVLLWEMVQRQWPLFEDRDDTLTEALFKLRASQNPIILESTNSLISLLCEVTEPLFFISVLHTAFERYLKAHPSDEITTGAYGVFAGDEARASGHLFGLTALGLCVLRLPKEVMQIEGARLAPLITEALGSETATTRQAANTLILAIQAVLDDPQATMDLFPGLNAGQKNLAHYLMEKNGLLKRDQEGDDDGGKRDRVGGEMVTLLGRGTGR